MTEWENERNNVNKKQAENLDGLLERISIAHDIGYWLGIALTFIFLSIEMGPIFFKMMMNKGPYDYMVENYNYRMYVQNGIVKEEMIFEGRDGMKLMEKVNYLEVENDRKEKIEKLKAQDEISKKIIGAWTKSKISEVDTDAAKFYSEEQKFNPKA
jgi:nitric oxide synthase oxygenase domain/subunit